MGLDGLTPSRDEEEGLHSSRKSQDTGRPAVVLRKSAAKAGVGELDPRQTGRAQSVSMCVGGARTVGGGAHWGAGVGE